MLISIDASRANRYYKTGTEWYSYHLIQNLKKVDQENHYFLYTDKRLRGDLANLPDNFEEKLLKWPFKYLWTQGRLSLEMKFSKEKPDVLFVPAHTIPIIHPKKTITTIHDLGFERFPYLYSFWQRKYLKWSARYALKKATKIITVSNFTKNELIKIYQADPKKIEVVYLGYDKGKYCLIEDREEVNKRLKKYNIFRPYLLYVGRLEKKKNVLGLIRAFNLVKNKDLKLVLVGKFGYGYEEIEEEISKLNLKRRIIQPGWVEEKDIPYLLNGAELFVFPSFYEGFGLPNLEAMACGCPVITSNVASLPEIAGGAALLVNPNNLWEIAQKIERIIGERGVRNELIEKGLERVKNFSWIKCAKETLEVLLKNEPG